MKTRWRGYGLALGWPMLMAWVALVAILLLTFHPTVSPDSNMYYDTARALRAMPHVDLAEFATTVWGSKQPGACPVWDGQSYKYPPLLAILFAPLTLLSCAGATMGWRVVTLVLWGLCAFALTRAPWRPNSPAWAFVACALVALYLPLIDGMLLGQIHLAILASCLAGAALVARQREFSGGAVLAAGAWIKYVPGAVVAYYLLTGRWRVAVGALVSGAVLLLAQVAIVGPLSLMDSLSPSLFAVTGAVWAGWPGGMAWGLAACLLFAMGIVTTRWGLGARGDDTLGIGWALCTMLFFSPVIQWLYLTWLLPAFWACLTATWRIARGANDTRGWWQLTPLAGLALIFVVSLVPFNHFATSGAIIALWLLCGSLYLWSAGVRMPAAVRLQRPVARLAPSATSYINDQS